MSTPRTPPRTTESTVDSAKRNLSASAPSNDDQKRQKAEAEAPAWAASFFDNMDSKFTSLETKLGSLSDKIDAMEGLHSRVGELEEQVTANSDELEGMQESMARLFAENKKLFAENAQLREGMAKLEATKADSGWVASIHDEQLRNSLTVCGVERKPTEKSWNDCKMALAAALAKISPDYPQKYWVRAIQRAHRGKQADGKVPVIHCKFVSWADIDFITNAIRGDDAVNPGNLELYDKHCAHTEARRKKAVLKRSIVRGADKNIKAFVKYPADLMVKKPGDQRYNCIQKF